MLLNNNTAHIGIINSDHFTQVAEVFLEGTKTDHATFEIDTPSFESWDEKHLPFGRITPIPSNKILGWIVLSRVSERMANNGVARITIYVSKGSIPIGIEIKLLPKIIEESELKGI